ncbi:MAG: UDP-N-acetylmuramoyl-L-alanyl-D-glutamate--2,6-diaminopimelate ligase [Cytophagia bacterium]|nr:MAG: UDP-N-acetylmuramoyl-L-alanyl-D-glutamate--2,6-diaminopimelate ligase [Runella sp.]TAG17815.1 MAG: UDP-N-acetylmuramoyl-L-alanyl-D-glutamate--2,6-diaminopimelate ligase [Cytophagales bacterium]TAG37387.1 MAG: UDP-N-acetylmuramoyl-L-alanyl-D-glutamate--2,6-diaminopimelate ligase [Cytophagia bacterium]TAG51495.1 MAG: UDP-N-acetylmuramoyl-L-alanyl-D-glutamate--2,6-diaminopimelate ligase [Runella slithyformis]TAG78402.1 MAG: UDP-N-acetylmuramoyl-L-alanyl-D-glutamate--2,6-diaminopimelate lig
MSKTLAQLLTGIKTLATAGPPSVAIKSIEFDSRKVTEGCLFVAQKGTQIDGHLFIERAIELGASGILCQQMPNSLRPEVAYVQVENSARTMGLLASAFYEYPSTKMQLVGVTGTNGKTSCVTLLFKLFRQLGYRVGLLSTVQNQINDDVIPSTHTTPDAVRINELLAEMLRRGCTHCFMEVSSHAVVQERTAGLTFAGGVFTNITHDHLDFHQTFDNYIKAKKGFFDQLPKHAFALINIDDRRGAVMVQNTAAAVHTYSLQTVASFKGKLLADSLFGLQMEVENKEVWFKLIGRFNAYNLLAVYGAAVLLHEDPDQVLTLLSAITPPPGRFEQVMSRQEIVGIVDYAHTPDALQNVLETINELREGNQQVITVVGCGGNRDATKRPEMAKIACQWSTQVILTSDNPRLEDPAAILEQMQAGVPPLDFKKTKTIEDRRAAIQYAVSMAKPQDIILIAGKGHETYQDIQGVKHHFDDKEELKNAFEQY